MIAILTLVAVQISMPSTPASAYEAIPPPTVHSFSRVGPTVSYSASVAWPGESDCATSCHLGLQGQYEDGTLFSEASTYVHHIARTVTFAGTSTHNKAVVAYRLVSSKNGVVRTTTGWATLSDELSLGDSVPANGLSVGNVLVNRTDAQVTITATAAGGGLTLGRPCVEYQSCSLYLQAKLASGTSISLSFQSGTSLQSAQSLTSVDQFSFTRPVTVKSTEAYGQIESVRAVVLGPNGARVDSPWTPVADSVPSSPLRIIVNSISATASSTSWNLAVVGAGFGPTPNSPCAAWNCHLIVEAQRATGQVVGLHPYANYGYSYDLSSLAGGFSVNWSSTGTISYIDLVKVRAVLYGPGGSVATGWVPVSSNVVGGHDLEYGYTAFEAAAAVTGLLTVCANLALYPGTHVSGSSVPDHSLACTAAAQTMTARQLAVMMVGQFGPGIMATLLHAAHWAAPPLTDSTPPVTWEWTEWPYNEPGNENAPAPPRPPAAPLITDPTFETLLADRLLAQGWLTGGGLATDPAFNTDGSARQVATEVARQCIALAVAEGFDQDKCKTLPIFSPGSDLPEVAKHKWDAIVGGSPSQPALLNYLTSDQKFAATGLARNWYTSVCQGSMSEDPWTACDEYPYYSSVQGGPGSSLKVLNFAQNSKEGSLLGWFGKHCGLREPQSATDTREYLVIPLPFDFGPVTTGWCNGRQKPQI